MTRIDKRNGQNEKWTKLIRFVGKMQKKPDYRALHGGLLLLIPVLLTGAFSLALRNLPIPAYLSFIQSFGNGVFYRFLNTIYSATFNLLAVYATLCIGISYGREISKHGRAHFGSIATSMITFFIMSGCTNEEFSFDSLGPKGMFIAILSAIIGSRIYWCFRRIFHKSVVHYGDGADYRFNRVLNVMLPLAASTVVIAIADMVLCSLTNVSCIYDLFIREVNELFALPMSDFSRAFVYILSSSILWFFGIHGSDCLEGVAESFFIPADKANALAVSLGQAPTHIFTKGFFDVFVLIGGCGTAVCLLLALLLFGKRRSNRLISKLAALPMLFNINEVLIFGLPVILNPIMLIPFLTVPLISFTISYQAMRLGIVPLVSTGVEWTTPVLLGGYVATGSIRGLLLQVVNLTVGTLIYRPFVRLLDVQMDYMAKESYNELIDVFKAGEKSGNHDTLCDMDGSLGMLAKALAGDIGETIKAGKFEMYYQPQYNYAGCCVGVEALLRMNHPIYGFLYPPLVVKLAGETDCLLALDCAVADQVFAQTDYIKQQFGEHIKISINVSGDNITQQAYANHLSDCFAKYPIENCQICLELTEQVAVHFDAHTAENFERLKGLGIRFAIDDFSMGQTSIDYLKRDLFTMLKLDGSLTKGILTNPHCFEIISSLSSLADSLNIEILAEYVETEEQKEALHRAGCDLYQGYLFSPAVALQKKKG